MISYSKYADSAVDPFILLSRLGMFVIASCGNTVLINICISYEHNLTTCTYNIYHLPVDNVFNKSCCLWQWFPAVAKSMPRRHSPHINNMNHATLVLNQCSSRDNGSADMPPPLVQRTLPAFSLHPWCLTVLLCDAMNKHVSGRLAHWETWKFPGGPLQFRECLGPTIARPSHSVTQNWFYLAYLSVVSKL